MAKKNDGKITCPRLFGLKHISPSLLAFRCFCYIHAPAYICSELHILWHCSFSYRFIIRIRKRFELKMKVKVLVQEMDISRGPSQLGLHIGLYKSHTCGPKHARSTLEECRYSCQWARLFKWTVWAEHLGLVQIKLTVWPKLKENGLNLSPA